MAIIVTVLRASDNTVTQADRAPNLMNAVATAAAARKGMNMGNLSGWVGGMEKRPGCGDVVLDGEVEDA